MFNRPCTCGVESSVQLFPSEIPNSHLEGLVPALFPDGGPYPNQVIEIVGSPESKKIHLALDLLVRCILPANKNSEWKERGIIYICTNKNISIIEVLEMIDAHLDHMNIHPQFDIKHHILTYNLNMLHSYHHGQLEEAFNDVNNVIQRKRNISFVMIDNIAAEYLPTSKVSCYCHSLENFARLYGSLKNLNIVMLFIRNENVPLSTRFSSKVDYRIQVEKVDDNNNYKAVVTNYEKKTKRTASYHLETIPYFQ